MGRTFPKEIYAKKRTRQPRGADAPFPQLQTCASQSSFVSTEKLPNLCNNLLLGLDMGNSINNYKNNKNNVFRNISVILSKKYTKILIII